MAGSLHGSARTTPRVRAELQGSKDTTSSLAQRYGLSRTTVTKWRARSTTSDAPMGPTLPRSTVLSAVEEAMIVEFRRRTLLPLDDVFGCLRDTIPKLTCSSLHRCLERHSALIAERTRSGLAAARARGRVGGNPGLRGGDACAIQKMRASRDAAHLDRVLARLDSWLPTVRQMRPDQPWGDIVRVLNHGQAATWTVERLRRTVRRLAREGIVEAGLLDRARPQQGDDVATAGKRVLPHLPCCRFVVMPHSGRGRGGGRSPLGHTWTA